eukprot:505549-Prymnesium_polylepis.1
MDAFSRQTDQSMDRVSRVTGEIEEVRQAAIARSPALPPPLTGRPEPCGPGRRRPPDRMAVPSVDWPPRALCAPVCCARRVLCAPTGVLCAPQRVCRARGLAQGARARRKD